MVKLFFLLFIGVFMFNYQNFPFEIQGHRGARGLLPENTIPAFKKAIDLGVNTLEMDVVISKDRKVVVSHEPNFNPLITTKPDGNFFSNMSESNLFLMNYSEIKKYDVGLKGHSGFKEQQKIKAFKPLLADVIEEMSRYSKSKGLKDIRYNIELKSLPEEYNITQPEVSEFCDLVLKVIGNKIAPKDLTLQSFDFNVLKHLEKNYKGKFSISVLIEPEENNEIQHNLEKLGFKPDIWSPFFLKLNKEMVQELHKKSIRVIPWTVNIKEDMEKLKKMGCDGIITDYPNRAVNLN